MLFIVFYHASGLGNPDILMKTGKFFLYFSLEVFFLISGYLAASTLRSRGSKDYFNIRIPAVLLPLITISILVNPFIHYFRHGFRENVRYGSYTFTEAIRSSISGKWDGYELHLWFLVLLLIYIILLPLLTPVLTRMASVMDRVRPSAIMFWLALLLAVYMVCASFVIDHLQAHRLAQPFARYMPYFLIGSLAFMSQNLRNALHRIDAPLVLLMLLGLALVFFYDGPGWGHAKKFGRSLISFSLVVFIMLAARKFLNGRNYVSDIFSRSIYTTYLLHTFFIFLLFYLLDIHTGQVTPYHVVFATILAVAISTAIHLFLIERYGFMAFLFNGKANQKAKPTNQP
ncbi:acyltransferase family protein [Paracoccus sp. 11-3]|uniref:Acyltransferase family protein n=2 Tax=Paracoccus amoyensis TaxID=2760093 RepID=A0A926GE16_9RHOB|nr:acyltransferase family protein [Paracoccus amoyensis]